VIKDGMKIGEDFEVVSVEMWRMLVRHFIYAEVQKHRKGEKIEGEKMKGDKYKIEIVR
jgi:hypothetical protein